MRFQTLLKFNLRHFTIDLSLDKVLNPNFKFTP